MPLDIPRPPDEITSDVSKAIQALADSVPSLVHLTTGRQAQLEAGPLTFQAAQSLDRALFALHQRIQWLTDFEVIPLLEAIDLHPAAVGTPPDVRRYVADRLLPSLSEVQNLSAECRLAAGFLSTAIAVLAAAARHATSQDT